MVIVNLPICSYEGLNAWNASFVILLWQQFDNFPIFHIFFLSLVGPMYLRRIWFQSCLSIHSCTSQFLRNLQNYAWVFKELSVVFRVFCFLYSSLKSCQRTGPWSWILCQKQTDKYQPATFCHYLWKRWHPWTTVCKLTCNCKYSYM